MVARPVGSLIERLGLWTDDAKPLFHQVEDEERSATSLHLEGVLTSGAAPPDQ